MKDLCTEKYKHWRKKLKKTTKWKNPNPMFTDMKNTVKMSILTKSIYRFNVGHIKILKPFSQKLKK